jgi:hypothetical protein
MSETSPTPEEEAALDGSLGGGVSGPEDGVSAGTDDADRERYQHAAKPRTDPAKPEPDDRDGRSPGSLSDA